MSDEVLDKVICMEKISKAFKYRKGKIQALKDISFSVERGKIFALLGPNGAGKTTLIKILLNFVFPDQGSVFLFNHNVNDRIARQKVGYVPEDLSMPDFPDATSFLYFLGRLSGMVENVLQKKIPELLELTGLANSTHPINKFSKGMKRRLSIAQAIIHQPELLILDEPTDGLDPIERKRILNLLKDFCNAGGTIFLCSHVLTEVEYLCDQFIILNQGQIVYNSQKDQHDFDEYFISIESDLPKSIIDLLPKNCTVQNSQFRKGIFVNNKKALNDVISLLTQNNITIEQIQKQNNTLSELFFKYINKKHEINTN